VFPGPGGGVWRSIYEPASVGGIASRPLGVSVMLRAQANCNCVISLLFQWSSLPMERNRIARYWTLVKLFTGGLMQGNNLWLVNLYARIAGLA